jgi:pimeloyl-ACP methyl ester carboxylesterase
VSAEVRTRGPAAGPAVICLNGGRAAAVEGTWSASLEWLVDRLAPRFPQLRFAEVRYRVKSWNHFESCREDARTAIAQLDAERTLLLGFSMGGAVFPVESAGKPRGLVGRRVVLASPLRVAALAPPRHGRAVGGEAVPVAEDCAAKHRGRLEVVEAGNAAP